MVVMILEIDLKTITCVQTKSGKAFQCAVVELLFKVTFFKFAYIKFSPHYSGWNVCPPRTFPTT